MSLAAENLRVMRGPRPVLDGVSLALTPGALTAILGPNGAGKTTLVRALAGVLTPQSGRVTLDGTALAAIAPDARAGRIAYLPQGRDAAWNMRAADVVALGRFHAQRLLRPLSDDDRRAIARAMVEADVVGLAERGVKTLSGGEFARVLLARALAVEAPVMLADEPVAGLDPAHQLRVMAALQARAREGVAAAIVMHDLTLAAQFCDRIVLLADGRIAADGTPDAVLTEEILFGVYGVRLTRGAGFGPAV
ncbi:Fe(3+) dicitrate transport ATP-binding protein FecE [Alphaproteobacteria bacterium SO-S41]|nr:Fe(3+) dicitrate transport ATP-binding protein FecE [Alphaproteobacteria bacterium SO-S41]